VKKRFTDCDKWRDPWFRRLSVQAKLVWLWLLDNCDNAGVIDVDIELAAFQIGEEIKRDALNNELKDKVEKLPNGKVWIPNFIHFQYSVGGKKLFSSVCKPHQVVLESLEKNGLIDRVRDTLPKGYGKGPRKEKDKDKDKDPPAGAEKKKTILPTVEDCIEFAPSVPCSKECAEAYHADRSALDWSKVKSGVQVAISDWRNDLRSFARHWRFTEQEQKARAGTKVARVVNTKPVKELKL
jgi:hypothetical protein